MQLARPARPFDLEEFMEIGRRRARYKMCSSGAPPLSLRELLEWATEEEWEAIAGVELEYVSCRGTPALRTAISASYSAEDDLEVCVTSGSEEAIYLIATTLLRPEDHAIIVSPCFQSAESIAAAICEISSVALNFNRREVVGGSALAISDLERAVRPNSRLVYINFPNNPTGATISTGTFSALISFCRAHDLILISDEIFRGSEFDPADRLPAACEVYENAVSIASLSKMYGLSGLRTGWAISQNGDLIDRISHGRHYLSMCSSAVSEKLAAVGLRMQRELWQRTINMRNKCEEMFASFAADHPRLLEYERPAAGIFAYPRYLGHDGVESFTERLLEETGVMLAPARLFKSAFVDLPQDRFRVGFNRPFMPEALDLMSSFLAQSEYQPA